MNHDDHTHDPMSTLAPDGTCVPKMDMSLHWGTCEWILVRTWKADTPGKLVNKNLVKKFKKVTKKIKIIVGKFWFAAFVIFLSAIAYEGLKYYREVLYYHTIKTKETVVKQSDGTFIRTQPKLSLKVCLNIKLNYLTTSSLTNKFFIFFFQLLARTI